jgi:predicted DNA-binding transcriptional regulator AlpA
MKTGKPLAAQRAAAKKKISEKVKELAEAQRRTISVPEAGRLLGVSRNSAYAYAEAGLLPTLRLGNRLLVLKAPFEKMLQEDH